ncbi:putative sugar nucleotidyl transferase, partial [Bacteroidota bacterium]
GSHQCVDYLSKKFPADATNDNLFINGGLIPNSELVAVINSLTTGKLIKKDNKLLAFRTNNTTIDPLDAALLNQAKEYTGRIDLIDYPWKIFSLNGSEIAADFSLLTAGKVSIPLSKTVNILGDSPIFAEEGFKGEFITLNSSAGPIYLGKDSEVMEGSTIRGPFALGDHAVVKLGSKIYGPTTLGPHCKVGGEVNNSVLLSYSNKGHDGFLGNAVIGEWCNLGADTNNSNLKNNYTEVKIWNYPEERFVNTRLQFCGLIMGDHSKCAINTMFNTGTVVGVSANIFGSGFPRNFIPSFTWGGASGITEYRLDKAFETMERVMERREIALTEIDRKILEHVYSDTKKYRSRI